MFKKNIYTVFASRFFFRLGMLVMPLVQKRCEERKAAAVPGPAQARLKPLQGGEDHLLHLPSLH